MATGIDQDGLTGHKAMTFDHLHDAFRDIVRRARMLLGRVFLDAFHVFVIAVALPILLPFGADEAGTDRIDPNFRRQNTRQGKRHRIHRPFRRRVGNRAADTGDAGNRSDIHNRPVTGRPQRLLRRAYHLESSEDIDRERALPNFRCQRLQIRVIDVSGRARVVDQHVKASPFRCRLVDDPAAIPVIGDIALDEQDFRSRSLALRDRILGFVRAARVVDGDIVPALRQHESG